MPPSAQFQQLYTTYVCYIEELPAQVKLSIINRDLLYVAIRVYYPVLQQLDHAEKHARTHKLSKNGIHVFIWHEIKSDMCRQKGVRGRAVFYADRNLRYDFVR